MGIIIGPYLLDIMTRAGCMYAHSVQCTKNLLHNAY